MRGGAAVRGAEVVIDDFPWTHLTCRRPSPAISFLCSHRYTYKRRGMTCLSLRFIIMFKKYHSNKNNIVVHLSTVSTDEQQNVIINNHKQLMHFTPFRATI